MARRDWSLALAAALALALVSLASNITTVEQLSGEADILLAVRFTFSKLVNSGAVWAGLAVLSGWLLRRPVAAIPGGIVAFLFALVAHYGLGRIFGLYDSDVWGENTYWFAAALVLGGPLGLAGAVGRRPDVWGLPARLLVPVGAVLEPFVLGMFTRPAIVPWPDRASSVASGSILVLLGIAGGAAILITAMQSLRRRKAST